MKKLYVKFADELARISNDEVIDIFTDKDILVIQFETGKTYGDNVMEISNYEWNNGELTNKSNGYKYTEKQFIHDKITNRRNSYRGEPIEFKYVDLLIKTGISKLKFKFFKYLD